MIKYDRFWETLKRRHISQYALYEKHGIDKKLLDRLRKNDNVEIYTLDRLCTILDCNLEDIAEHVPDENDQDADQEVAAALLKNSSGK